MTKTREILNKFYRVSETGEKAQRFTTGPGFGPKRLLCRKLAGEVRLATKFPSHLIDCERRGQMKNKMLMLRSATGASSAGEIVRFNCVYRRSYDSPTLLGFRD